MRFFIVMVSLTLLTQALAQNTRVVQTEVFVNGLNSKSTAKVELDLEFVYNIANQVKKVSGVAWLNEMIVYDIESESGYKQGLIIEEPTVCHVVHNTLDSFKNGEQNVLVNFDCSHVTHAYAQDMRIELYLSHDLEGMIKIVSYGDILFAKVNGLQ